MRFYVVIKIPVFRDCGVKYYIGFVALRYLIVWQFVNYLCGIITTPCPLIVKLLKNIILSFLVFVFW
jgi:hypothetical protein